MTRNIHCKIADNYMSKEFAKGFVGIHEKTEKVMQPGIHDISAKGHDISAKGGFLVCYPKRSCLKAISNPHRLLRNQKLHQSCQC
jgi:hypothetical protein